MNSSVTCLVCFCKVYPKGEKENLARSIIQLWSRGKMKMPFFTLYKGRQRYGIPNEIAIVFHNGSNYDYHYFIIAELAAKVERQFTHLAEST